MAKIGNGNGWISKALAALFLASIISYLGWAGIQITAAQEKYSLKTECALKRQQLKHDMQCMKQEELERIKDINRNLDDLRKEQRELIKAVYKSIRSNG